MYQIQFRKKGSQDEWRVNTRYVYTNQEIGPEHLDTFETYVEARAYVKQLPQQMGFKVRIVRVELMEEFDR